MITRRGIDGWGLDGGGPMMRTVYALILLGSSAHALTPLAHVSYNFSESEVLEFSNFWRLLKPNEKRQVQRNPEF